jgi:type II secretory pathway pseudopilin PulG
MDRLRDQAGFTIVEVMVATAILLGGVLGTLAMMQTANQRTRTADDRQRATALARDVVEAVRGVSYRRLAEVEVVEELQRADGLAGNGSTTDWRVERGGTVYAVDVDVCALDDDIDGLGSRAAGGFCADNRPAGTEDGSPADYKRVAVTASWQNGSGTGQVRQATLVGARGHGDAPAVTSLLMTAPSAAPITNPATTSASFTVRTSVNAESAVWTVDGVQQGPADGSGRDFAFRWDLPPLDGSYDVGVQAFDTSGVGGAPKSLTIVVNRFVPAAPPGWNAGRNGAVVEVEWMASPERDVVRYRVYRRSHNGAAQLVCETETATSCVDPAPPAPTGTALSYWVVALDRTTGEVLREGAPSTAQDVNIKNEAPSPPSNLTLELDAEGRRVLRWSLPDPADPDRGDGIASFRIYRDGTAVTDRYDRTGSGTDTVWTDTDGVGSHTYWITAVDSHLHESTLVGPVEG